MLELIWVRQKIEKFLKNFTWLDWLLVGLLGAGGVYLFLFSFSLWQRPRQSVEYIAAEENGGQNLGPAEIWVDISGAVASPGVYQLPGGARIKDALVAAGGLTSSADRDFVARAINLAAKAADGDKVYIPAAGGEVAGAVTGRVNLNKASAGQLETLSGIGQVRAAQIIENRPYASIDDLVTKKIISAGILDKIRDKVAVY